MMDAKHLFIARCDQLEQNLRSASGIDVLDLSGILRQLLADKHSLLGAANKSKMPIRFRVNRFRELPPGLPAPTYRAMEDGLDPDTSPPIYPPPVELTLDDFLKHVVLVVNGQENTVKDVIKFAANVAGGVHHDPNPKPEYETIKAFSDRFGIGGLPAGIRQLMAIARVTLKALQPLLEDLRKPAQPRP